MRLPIRGLKKSSFQNIGFLTGGTSSEFIIMRAAFPIAAAASVLERSTLDASRVRENQHRNAAALVLASLLNMSLAATLNAVATDARLVEWLFH